MCSYYTHILLITQETSSKQQVMLYKHHYTMYTNRVKYCVYIECNFSLTVWSVVVLLAQYIDNMTV